MLQNFVFRGTNEGRSLYIHNKTDFNQLGSLSVDITSDSVVDIATYSLENQPIVDSKQTKRWLEKVAINALKFLISILI